MNGQQNLTEFWDDSISLEEPDFWDNVAKEPETVPELLGKDFLYHATYKPYWEEIKKDGYIKPGKHTNWDNRYKTTRAIYLATDYDNAVYYAKNAENVPKELLNQNLKKICGQHLRIINHNVKVKVIAKDLYLVTVEQQTNIKIKLIVLI